MHRLRLGILSGLAVVLTAAGVVLQPFDADLVALAGLSDSSDAQAGPAGGPAAPTAPPTEEPSDAAADEMPSPAPLATTAAARSTTDAAQVRSRSAGAGVASISLRMVTYNTLGSLHTEPGGDRQYFAPAELRAQWGADLLRQQRADIVGFQELRPNQITSFQREFPTYAFWPNAAVGSIGRPTTMMWNDTVLEKISSSYIDIPSMGTTRRMSYVLLEHRATGRRLYYLNVHNSPGPRQGERDTDLAIETAKINELRATGHPVFMGGDMNEREKAVCTVLAKTDLVSSAGGTITNGICQAPARPRIDWIFGNATFSNFAMMQPPLVRRATDHWIIATTATLN